MAREPAPHHRPLHFTLTARLVDKGWLERIEKGKYLIVPLEAGPDRTWTEDAHVIAGHLVSPSMVSHWSALNYWNLTEQVPRVTYVQTTARSYPSVTPESVQAAMCYAAELAKERVLSLST